ncbi:MAG: hypothetical protein A4E55_02487 [Pelotomaculum sp. PtaU1.Bin035]|nr:MAG: hypothetical protein A4E55_02487 [Pelotomaculum sp. PtaU1.Bin035]
MIKVKVYSMTETPLWIRPLSLQIPNHDEQAEEVLKKLNKHQQLIARKIAVEYSYPRASISGKLLKGETLGDLRALDKKLEDLSADEIKNYGLALEDLVGRDVKSLILLADRVKSEMKPYMSQTM